MPGVNGPVQTGGACEGGFQLIRLERILCPVDFSESSARALDYALAVSKHHRSELAVLHVLPRILGDPDVYPYLSEPVFPNEATRERAFGQLGHFVHRALSEKHPVDVILADGRPLDNILERIEKLPADLLVMGTHGRGGFRRLVLGSVTEKALRLATCPVLTVSPKAPGPAVDGTAFKRVLCPIDFSPSSTKGFEMACSLVQDQGELILLHVADFYPEPGDESGNIYSLTAARERYREQALDKMGALADEFRSDRFRLNLMVLEEIPPYRGILKLADERHSELIVVGIRGRGPADLAFFGSTANHVVREALCPVLTVRSETT